MRERIRRSLVRVGAMASKEARHILRDPRTLYMSLGMPIVMLFLFGYGVALQLLRAEAASGLHGPMGEATGSVSAVVGDHSSHEHEGSPASFMHGGEFFSGAAWRAQRQGSAAVAAIFGSFSVCKLFRLCKQVNEW